nr:hypothetical protein CFP56_07980 [Quercus suber]
MCLPSIQYTSKLLEVVSSPPHSEAGTYRKSRASTEFVGGELEPKPHFDDTRQLQYISSSYMAFSLLLSLPLRPATGSCQPQQDHSSGRELFDHP